MLSRRHRRRHYALAPTRQKPQSLRPVITVIIVGALLFFVGGKVLQFFGVGNALRSNAVVLELEGQGTVNVSIEGEDFQRAEDNLKIYPGDQVKTSGRASALLSFFDGTRVRMDERTQIAIEESVRGEEESRIALELTEGTIWLATPTAQTFSGSIIREVRTANLSLQIPSRAEVLITPSSFAVFAADHLGITTRVMGQDEPILIGEGQKYSVPEGEIITGDPYRNRSPLDPTVVRSVFLEESRSMHLQRVAAERDNMPAPEAGLPTGTALIVTEPQEGVTVQTSTVRVAGQIDAQVTRVRINGYAMAIEEGQQTFSQDLALPDQDEVTIFVEALAADGTVLEEITRTILRNRKPPEPPVITAPAQSGQTYLTQRQEIEITGKATPDTVGIIVNDYRLQLFKPGDDTWSYLANTKFDNYVFGRNEYTVSSINSNGLESEPAVITIILGEGEEGVLEEQTGTQEGAAAASSEELPDNVPELPGSLSVTHPTPGTFHAATGSSVLIEGAVPERTHSVWVNDYQLQLYEPGKTFWNYIADTKLNTMQRGTNVYRIVARDSEGKILDEMEYTVYFDPRES